LPFFLTITVALLLGISILCITISSIPWGVGKLFKELAAVAIVMVLWWLVSSILHSPFTP
jgi:hypothetical protein